MLQYKLKLEDIDAPLFKEILEITNTEMVDLSRFMNRSDTFIFRRIEHKTIGLKDIFSLREKIGKEQFESALEILNLRHIARQYHIKYTGRSKYMLVRNLIEQKELIEELKEYVETLEDAIESKSFKYKKKYFKYPDIIGNHQGEDDEVTLEDNYPYFEFMKQRINQLDESQLSQLLQKILNLDKDIFAKMKFNLNNYHFDEFAMIVSDILDQGFEDETVINEEDVKNDEIKDIEDENFAKTKPKNEVKMTEIKNQSEKLDNEIIDNLEQKISNNSETVSNDEFSLFPAKEISENKEDLSKLME